MEYNDLQTKILTEFTGILFRGLKANYKPAADHLDKLYFATDTHELLVNGTSYSGGISTNGFYRIPGNIEDINVNTNPEGLRIVLGDYLNLKNAVLSKNIIVTGTSILNVVIGGIDGLSVIIEYMYFGENKISKYQYFLRIDEYYKWKRVFSIQEQILLKVDVAFDDTSNNAVANKAITSITKKIIDWH